MAKHSKKTKKKKTHRCRICKTNCYTERALRGHMIHCSDEPAPKNPVINNYTNASFNRHVTAGNINPHQFIANSDYLGQLHYYPSLNEQRHIHASSQNNDSTAYSDDVADAENDQHSTIDNNVDFNDSSMGNVLTIRMTKTMFQQPSRKSVPIMNLIPSNTVLSRHYHLYTLTSQ